jgi:hypothetical protein
MTDARLPSRWLFSPQMEALSDRAFRTFAGALMWSAEQGTDGLIPTRSMRLLHPDGSNATVVAEIVKAGLWDPAADGYQVRDWAVTQTLAADIARLREQNRNRQKASRERKKQAASGANRRQGVTGDVTRDGEGEERRGEDRRGEAALDDQPYWPVVQIPTGDQPI